MQNSIQPFCLIGKNHIYFDELILKLFQNFSFRDQTEICAANKIPYPIMKVYIRKKLRKPKNGKKYVFIHAKNKKNTVSNIFMGAKYGFSNFLVARS